MNSRIVIGLIGSFLGGAAAGIAGTYIYMKKSYCEKKIDEGIQDYILHRYDVETGEVLEDDAEGASEDLSPSEIANIARSSVPKYQTPVADRTPYNEFYEKKSPQDILAESEHPLDSNEDDEDNDVLDKMGESEREAYLSGLSASEEHAAYVRGEMNPIELISEDEFGKREDFDDDVLIYWLGDDIITTDLEEVIFDELKDGLLDADVFTDEWRSRAEADPDGNSLYIRHHEFMKDYEILPDTRAYWECH